ncbi:MAG: NAD(P)-dependent oxidoreductase [Lachnospiraceae bacterium]|nr:NAD(P)-dependent oxidoreductase [Lachnospiraceae bacterium]
MKELFVISGVTGMTGNELARQIIAKGGTVIGFDNFFASSLHTIQDILDQDAMNFFEWDINDEMAMKELENRVALEKDNYGRIVYINCAAVVHTEYFYDVEATFQTNVLGMRSFLEQAIRVGADAYINCSTSEVYSMQSWNEGGVSEEDYILFATAEHSQRTSYAAGKLLTEFFMKDAVDKGKIKGCSLRFANVYSDNELYAKHIIPHIITSLLEKQSVTLLENSRKNKRTFLHNFDSCQAVLAVIEGKNTLDGSVYNVATEEEVSILELVDICAKALNLEDYQIEFEGYRSADPERRLLSSKKLRERTNWSPMVSLNEGIKRCADYHMSKKD